MKDELKIFIHNYLENRNIKYFGEQTEQLKNLLKFFNSGILTYDHPDGFCKYEDNVLIIEHFEFDSSCTNKKGSKNRQEIFRTSNYEPQKDTGIEIFRDEIKCDYTIENYVDNLIKNFNKHYDEIEKYKKDLEKKQIITKNTNVETLFCIEDATALGNMDSATGEPLIPLMCKEFIDIIKKCPKLDYIITGSSIGQSNYTWFSSTLKIDYYIKNSYSKDVKEIANLNPQTIVGFGHI